jgi:AcrR family transcriptional regulator
MEMNLEELLERLRRETGNSPSPSRVRLYLEEGLLPPPREGSFGVEHVERLKMIEYLRSRYGMSLEDIGGIFGIVGGGREEKEERAEAPERKKEILKNAATLFSAKGYHGTTVDEIVQASGIAKGTFYLYFRSKEELLVEVMKQLIEDTFRRIESRLEGRDLDAVSAIEVKGEELLQLFLDNKELMHMFIGETVGNPRLVEEMKDIYKRLAGTVEEELARGISRGEIVPFDDLRTVSYAVVGMGQTVAFLLSAGEEIDPKETRRTVHELLHRALSPPK